MVRIYGNTTEKTEDEEWTAVLGKIKESIDKSLVSVSVKSGTYLETEKLKAKVGGDPQPEAGAGRGHFRPVEKRRGEPADH